MVMQRQRAQHFFATVSDWEVTPPSVQFARIDPQHGVLDTVHLAASSSVVRFIEQVMQRHHAVLDGMDLLFRFVLCEEAVITHVSWMGVLRRAAFA